MEGVCVCAKEGEMWWEVQENLLTIPVIPNRYVLSNLCVKYSETKQTHRQQNSLSKMKRRTGEIHHYQRYAGEIHHFQRYAGTIYHYNRYAGEIHHHQRYAGEFQYFQRSAGN